MENKSSNEILEIKSLTSDELDGIKGGTENSTDADSQESLEGNVENNTATATDIVERKRGRKKVKSPCGRSIRVR